MAKKKQIEQMDIFEQNLFSSEGEDEGGDEESPSQEIQRTSKEEKEPPKEEKEPSDEEKEPSDEEKEPSKKEARKTRKTKKTEGPKTAETMAKEQRAISVSEFFAKNRHLLGFDNPRKALLVTVKEAVDNSLDACEEAGILPSLSLNIKALENDQFRITSRDNGPGIVKKQIPNIFGKLLYGSKFHQLKMSRGQQGIGIAAAGMYGLMTTGKAVQIISKTGIHSKAHYYELQIDTAKNQPEIITDEEYLFFPHGSGTEVSIDLVGKYQRGRTSVDQYLRLTAIANPHAQIEYKAPDGNHYLFQRASEELPPRPSAIQPHPYGVELGVLIKMLKESKFTKLGQFLKEEFSRVSSRVAQEIVDKAGLNINGKCKRIAKEEAAKLHRAMSEVKIMAPPTDCLVPIGVRNILSGLHKEIRAGFYTATTRPPAVYRGMPFQVEVGLAYGGELPKEDSATLIRFANRVPLLYQQSACMIFKSVTETIWSNYGVSQSKGSLPSGPLMIMVHLASVWVPFTSESKEAVANYDEIRKEVRLALGECGRKLAAYIRKKARAKRASQKRSVFERYIGEIVTALGKITEEKNESLKESLLELSKEHTELADAELEEELNGDTKEDKILNDQETILIIEDEEDNLG